jgi:flagellar biosynthesis protein FlhG
MPQPEFSARSRLTRPVQVIAVTGGKGGTGKTSIAVNLATALAQSGRSTLLLDGDLGLANVDVQLGLTPRCTLEHVLRGERSLQEVIVETAVGLRVVPAASGITRMASLAPGEQATLIEAFNALPAHPEVLVIDTAAGISPTVLHFCQAAQHVLIVLRDEPTSLTDSYAMVKVLSRSHGVRRFRVLANMIRRAGQGEAAFRRLQRVTDRYLDVLMEYVGEIPEDMSLQRAVQSQRSVIEAYPESQAARAFRRLARTTDAWGLPEGPSGRLEFFLERMLTRPEPRLTVLQ